MTYSTSNGSSHEIGHGRCTHKARGMVIVATPTAVGRTGGLPCQLTFANQITELPFLK